MRKMPHLFSLIAIMFLNINVGVQRFIACAKHHNQQSGKDHYEAATALQC